MLNNKKNLSSCEFYRSGGPQSENQRNENIDQYLDLARELKNRVT